MTKGARALFLRNLCREGMQSEGGGWLEILLLGPQFSGLLSTHDLSCIMALFERRERENNAPVVSSVAKSRF